jgi:predicted DNA-binding protein with PD1-like motif
MTCSGSSLMSNKEELDKQWYEQKLKNHETGQFKSSVTHVLRLSPGEDLLSSLWKYARVTGIKAASIVSCVGSLQRANIRYSNAETGAVINDYFEIVSLVGNVDLQSNPESLYPSSMGTKEGSSHVHISLSDKDGKTIGGHLLAGNLIYTTAEITLLEIKNGLFTREMDDKSTGGSGYYELKVYHDSNDNENEAKKSLNEQHVTKNV